MIGEARVRKCVQLAGLDVGLEMPIPLGGIEGCKPLPEPGQLLGREAANIALKLLDLRHRYLSITGKSSRWLTYISTPER